MVERLAHCRRALVVSCACLGFLLLAPVGASAVTAPGTDPFYAAPQNLARFADGTILRERTVTMSGAQTLDTAAAYQLMYRTTNASGQAVAAVTTLLIPKAPASGPRRLASYQTAYDSLTLKCAPSYTLQGGNGGGGDTATLETGLIASELALGWDVVVPDYEGLDSEWVVGPMIGRATLDSIRAVEQFSPAGLQGVRTEVSLNGYSGGSEASTWAAALQPSYAPKLDIVGMAAGGNFPNLDYTLSQFDGSLWFGTAIGVLEAFSRAYPQLVLKDILNPAGLALAAADGNDDSGCGGSTLNEEFKNASDFTLFPTSAALAADPMIKNVLATASLDNAPMPKIPEFLYNGVDDELAHIQPVDALVAEYCAHGVVVDYDRDPVGLEHIEGIAPFWGAALVYLEERFDGVPSPDTCPAGTDLNGSGSTAAAPPSCPRTTGTAGSSHIGPVTLGMNRASVRRAVGSAARASGRRYQRFCSSTAALEVGFSSSGRAAWLLSANPAYAVRGVRTGMSLSSARRELRLGRASIVDGASWYVVGSDLFEVRRGRVAQVGVAARSLVRTSRSRAALIRTIGEVLR